LIDEAIKEGREMEYCDGLFNVEGSHTSSGCKLFKNGIIRSN